MLDPHAVWLVAYGFTVCPPRELQPDTTVPRKFDHSDMFVLPRITMPAFRSCSITNASRETSFSASASDPAVVRIASAVAKMSFTTIGMPCSGPRLIPWLISSPRRSAISIASGFSSIIAFRPGPSASSASIRASDAATSSLTVNSPSSRPRRSEAIDASSTRSFPAGVA